MKTSRKIFIALLSMLAIVAITVCAGTFIDSGTFDLFSGIMAAGSIKASVFFMGINMTTLGQPDDLEFTEGSENMGGFGMTGYLALRSHIDTYPTEDTSNTDVGSLVKLIGSYTFITDRNFITLDFVPGTVKVTPEGQGEYVGGKSFRIKGEAFLATTGINQRGYARLLNNSFGVLILIRDDGSRVAFGTYQRPLEFKTSPDFGGKAADKNGILISFESDSFVPGYEYYGDIVLSGSTLPSIS
jgi:hypothetical protein